MLTTIHPEDTVKNKQGNDFKDFDNIFPLFPFWASVSWTMGNSIQQKVVF